MTDSDPNTPEAPRSAADANNVVPLTPAPAEPKPSEKVVGFIKRHPVLTVAGGVAAGVVVSALLPRKAGRKLLGRAVNLAEAAGAATMMFGRETSEKAHNLGIGTRRTVGTLATQAEKAGETTAARLEKYGLAAVAAASALGRATAKRAGKITEAASDKGHHIADVASDLRQRIKR